MVSSEPAWTFVRFLCLDIPAKKLFRGPWMFMTPGENIFRIETIETAHRNEKRYTIERQKVADESHFFKLL